MKIRKVISLGLASVMSLSLSAAIFAADPPNMETVFTSTYSKPDIKVTVPQTGTVALNPLGLDIDFGDGTDPSLIIKGQQIVTTPTVVVNNSGMDLSVGASISTKIEGTTPLKLTATQEALVGNGKADTASDYVGPKTDKSAFVFFQMNPTTLTDASVIEDINKDAVKWSYDYTEAANAEGTIVPKAGCLVLNATKVVKGENLVTLKAADVANSALKSGSIAQMRLCGKMVKSPARAENAWAEDDKLIATVTFTFSPAN